LSTTQSPAADEAALRAAAQAHGQEHVFRFWDALSQEQRGVLLAQLAEVNFPMMAHLIARGC